MPPATCNRAVNRQPGFRSGDSRAIQPEGHAEVGRVSLFSLLFSLFSFLSSLCFLLFSLEMLEGKAKSEEIKNRSIQEKHIFGVFIWQRAGKNCDQASARETWRAGAPPHFLWEFENFKNKQNLNFSKTLDSIELWNFKIISALRYRFYKLQYVLHNNYCNSQALSGSIDLQKLLSHGQDYRRVAAPSGPLSSCLVLLFSWREISCPSSSDQGHLRAPASALLFPSCLVLITIEFSCPGSCSVKQHAPALRVSDGNER